MRFLRHDGIYRSDVSLLLVNPTQMPPPDGRPRCRAIARDGRSTPCPSSAMSSGRLFLDRGGRHQSPSLLRRHPQNKSLVFRRASKYHRTAGSVLTVCVSRGDKRTRTSKSCQRRTDAEHKRLPRQLQSVAYQSWRVADKGDHRRVTETTCRRSKRPPKDPEGISPG